MAILLEEQWELDGFVFGAGQPIFVVQQGLDYGAGAVRTQDQSRTEADGIQFGRDFVDGPEMALTLGVQDEANVWDLLGALAQAWRPAARLVPGSMSTLRYCRNGEVIRYVGRPRKFGIKPGVKKNDQFQHVDVTFQLAEAVQYREGSANQARLQLLATDEGGGVTFPVTFPVRWAPGSQTRLNSINVNGAAATPFTCTIYGPASGTLTGVKVAGQGWSVTTSASVAWDQKIVIDTRAETITRNGTNIPGTLSRDSTLKGRLTPGAQTLTFAGADPTNTAYAVFEWFDALPI